MLGAAALACLARASWIKPTESTWPATDATRTSAWVSRAEGAAAATGLIDGGVGAEGGGAATGGGAFGLTTSPPLPTAFLYTLGRTDKQTRTRRSTQFAIAGELDSGGGESSGS